MRTIGAGALAALAIIFFIPPAMHAGTARLTVVHRLDEDIRIDGILDEDVWRNSDSIGEFRQVEPIPGEAPTEPTEVRLAYNDDALYIGVRCLDSKPEEILATDMSRDARLFSDDMIEILIDTFHDGRNAYYFQTNPLGALVDGRITENRFPDTNWDGIWNVRARVGDDGWTAEFEIPFQTLAFEDNNGTWGFNVERQLARNRERSRWASPSLDVRFTQVAMAGAFDGLEGISQGTGLDIKPYGLIGYSRDVEADPRTRFPHDAGVDVFYRVTSNLTSSTTINTDFAETEVDTRQVNLTRFSLFFPEKRAFFLEDAGIFDFGIQRGRGFGGFGGGGGGGGSGGRGQDMIPFFSRTIGLAEDQVIPIRVGQKLTGKVGRFDVGVLDVLTGETDAVERQNLFVGRTKANFWSQSYVGALVTHGEPTGATDNSLLGADLKLSTADFLKTGKNFSVTMYGAKTWTPDVHGDDAAYGVDVSYPNDLVTGGFEWQQIGENYNPALGYVRRLGVRKTAVRSGLRPRPEVWNIRQLSFQFFYQRYDSLIHHMLETRELRITPLQIEFDSGSRIQYQVIPTFERLFEPFEIQDEVTIPPGDYSFTPHQVSYFSAANRPWRLRASYEFGSFYSGHSDQLDTNLSWSNRNISTAFQLQQYWVRLKEGDFSTRLALVRFNYSFTPLITLSNFVQYDTASQNIGLQSRLRWILQPGNEIFLVLNHAWQESPLDRFEVLSSDIRAKLSYTFRF